MAGDISKILARGGERTFVSPERCETTSDTAGIQRGQPGSLSMKARFTWLQTSQGFILLSSVTPHQVHMDARH